MPTILPLSTTGNLLNHFSLKSATASEIVVSDDIVCGFLVILFLINILFSFRFFIVLPSLTHYSVLQPIPAMNIIAAFTLILKLYQISLLQAILTIFS